MRPSRSLVLLDIGLKLATCGLLFFAVANPQLAQFQGKAMAGRAIAYPFALVAVPVIWWLLGRGRMGYPVAADILLTAPFLIDVVGNALDLYDSIEWWDDANHLVNWALHTAAAGLLLRATGLAPLVRFGLAIAWASTTAVLWEFAEYLTFIRGGAEEATAYADTLGDLALGLLGGLVAAVLTAGLVARPPSPPPG
jgi:hypothetical protein